MTNLPIAKAWLERSHTADGFDVFVVTRRTPAWTETLEPLPPVTIHRTEVGGWHDRKPAFTLAADSAQALLDALWQAGIRPSSGQGAADVGVVKAMQAHIEDLRTMAGVVKGPPDRPIYKEAGQF